MSAADLSIVDEVNAAINAGSAEKRLETIRRVTDLFLLSAGTFNGEQIELFDNVLGRLIRTIEIRAVADINARLALAETSSQLASVAQAPPAVVRRLAGNDEIAIAGPVLAESARLSAEDLIEIAETKGEQHLLAVSGRWWLKEVVTDALLARRYPTVSRRIVNNPGARISAAGFAIVLGQAESIPSLRSKPAYEWICLRISVRNCCATNRSGAIETAVACATTPVRGNQKFNCGGLGGRKPRDVQEARLYDRQTIGGAAEGKGRAE